MRLKFQILLVTLFISLTQAFAGLKWVDIGVNGLTCSMCSRSVEMSLRKLDFVDSVVMSLEETEGRIFFKTNMPVNLKQIAKAVVNAGFSVRFVKLQLDFSDIPISNDGTFIFQGQQYQWVDFQPKPITSAELKLLDEHFLPKKESSEWKKKLGLKAQGSTGVLHVVAHG